MTSRGNTSAPRKRYLTKTEQIQTDNGYRMRWNREVDRAIVSGVAETEIQQIKKEYISDRIKDRQSTGTVWNNYLLAEQVLYRLWNS